MRFQPPSGDAERSVPAIVFDCGKSAITAADAEQLDRVAGAVDVLEVGFNAEITRGLRDIGSERSFAVSDQDVGRLERVDGVGCEITDANGQPVCRFNLFASRRLSNRGAGVARDAEEPVIEQPA